MKPNYVIGVILSVVSFVLMSMGVYGLEGIRRGTLASSAYNWNLTFSEIMVAWSLPTIVAAFYAAHSNLTPPTITPSPETETVEQILQRLERRVRQDTADKITGKAP